MQGLTRKLGAALAAGLALALGSVLCVGCRAAGDPRSTLALEPCQLSGPHTVERQEARCGGLEVPENPAEPAGRKIRLRIAVVPANGGKPVRDPLFMLAGGPGQAASEAFLPLLPALARLRKDRDIVLVDQRGTGQSNPLDCPERDEDPGRVTLEDIRRDTRLCLEGLQGDPRFYHTAIAMDDLEAVRQALGYDQINLYGGSYGTRAALVYLQRHGRHVRSIVLDAVNSPAQPLFGTIDQDARGSLERLIALCGLDPGCRETVPDLRGDLNRLLERVSESPREITFDHPITAEPTTVTVHRRVLVDALFGASYAPPTLALLPLLIHHAANTGILSRLMATGMLIQGDVSLHQGMHFSVVCTEDVPFLTDAMVEQLVAPDSLYHDRFRIDAMRAICELWPKGELPPEGGKTVSSDVPVLLLSGELDPVTPPIRAEQTAQTLSNSRHIVVSAAGHTVLLSGCMPTVVADFLQNPDPAALDLSCLERSRALPFFTSFRGPQP